MSSAKVEVAPRFTSIEPAPAAPQPVGTPQSVATPSTADPGMAAGLFTSISENKFIIGLIVVLILLAIGAAWYFGMGKSDTPKITADPAPPQADQPTAPPPAQPTAQQQPVAAQQAAAQQPAQQPAQQQQPVPTETADTAPRTKNDLRALITRASTPAQPQQQRTDDEIMRMMEDEVAES